MSPLIVGVIFFVAWRQCRRVNQAFTETGAWIVGYLGTYGVLALLHLGKPGLISLAPESFAFVIAVAGGFIAMKLSHWLWRRRGGHLEPTANPFAAKHWVRALRAMLFGGKKKTAARPVTRTPATRATPSTSTTIVRPAQPSAAARAGQLARRSQSNRWARVARAMLDTESSNRTRR